MKIAVQVKPNSRIESVEPIGPNEFVVRANAPATEGKANTRVIELLSKYFDKPKSKIDLISGVKSKTKKFLIND